ncbi:hypothetical protein [Paenibacillus sp. HB172176]|uniref:hypothetical protein n=1 Tax=Paenibacillus sp. HB172176 TaxID=2493690 RepID=UPI0014396C25|nr:hypothetical protein [Paenibacillus sp. HB172176]
MVIELTAIHYVYLAFVLLIISFMMMRRDTSLVCIVGIFVLGLLSTESLVRSVSGVFNSFIYAITELLGTILIISIIVAMSRILIRTGINEVMVYPFTKLIKTPALAFWVIGLLMMVMSWFFWPSPAVALMGAVLLPVAVRVGLPALGAAMAMNLFGHGIALSGDYIIQGAPKLTADAAGLPVGDVMSASVPLVIVMGLTTTVIAFWLLRRDMRRGAFKSEELESKKSVIPHDAEPVEESSSSHLLSASAKRWLAGIIPLLFALDVAGMFLFDLQGGDATALVGGTAVFIMIVITMLTHRSRGLEQITKFIIEGFQFGFKIFGPVIPIAAFFYLGDSAFTQVFGDLLPAGSHGLVNDLGVALANHVPVNNGVSAVTLTSVGAITGLDGSGFSGISLAGSIAHLFSAALGAGAATLTALGQISAIWVGGGTLVPWALIPAAAICGVDPFELARRNLKPVVIGLTVTTVVAMLIL